MAISTTTVAGTTVGDVAAVYTSVGNTAVTWATFTNFSGSAATLSLYVVPAAGSAANSNMVLDGESITAGDTFSLYTAGEKLLLENGDAIYAWSDTATAVNAVVSYASI